MSGYVWWMRQAERSEEALNAIVLVIMTLPLSGLTRQLKSVKSLFLSGGFPF